MRGKLEQPKGLIELIQVELERIDFEYRELWLSCEYTCPAGEYKSALALPIGNSKDMTNLFFRELLAEARHLSEMDAEQDGPAAFFVSNKDQTMLPIKNLCQRVVSLLDVEPPYHENREYIDLCTSGVNFLDVDKSLTSKDFDERFRIFMSRAREKMDQGYYTIAADDLEKARVLCSTSPLIYKLIGICHRELSHLDLAMDMFTTAMNLGDHDRDTYLYLAEVCFFLDDLPYAEEVLEEMLREFPRDIRAMVELANVRYQMDKPYRDLLNEAYDCNAADTRETILQTFAFKRLDDRKQKNITVASAAHLLGLPEQTIRALAARHRIPARQAAPQAELILDEHELIAWYHVYRDYDLIDNEIKRAASHPGTEIPQSMSLLS